MMAVYSLRYDKMYYNKPKDEIIGGNLTKYFFLINSSKGQPCKLPLLACRLAFFTHNSLHKVTVLYTQIEIE